MRYLASVLALAACGGEPAVVPDPVLLVDPNAWTLVAPTDDPFEPPAEVTCDEDAWGPDDFGGELAFDVDTWSCDWLTVEQPLLAPIAARDALTVRLWHFELVYTDSAFANLALEVDGELVWQRAEPIPKDSELLWDVWEAQRPAPAGSQVVFHVDNHGANSYHLLEFSATHADPEQ